MDNLKTSVYGIIGGVCISIGGCAFLSLDSKIAGAIFFVVGLFTICTFGFNLFTGKVCYALQNDALLLDGVLFAGSRGWLLPGESAKSEDRRIYDREVLRLEMSLKDARRLSPEAPLIALCH